MSGILDVDYVMLLSVRYMTSLNVKRRRLAAGALVGGIGSFAVLLPPMPFAVSLLISISEALLMTAAAFLPMNIRGYIRTAFLLFAVSFTYCGIMTAVLALASPDGLTVRNSSVYIGISPFALIALTALCYLVLRLFGRIKGSGIKSRKWHFIPNSIDVRKFAFNEEKRVDSRNSLNLADSELIEVSSPL